MLSTSKYITQRIMISYVCDCMLSSGHRASHIARARRRLWCSATTSMQPVRTPAQALRKQVPGERRKVPVVVTEDAAQRVGGEPEYDAVVLGGTLGLLVAARLQLAGHSVAVVERQRAVGRTQEWNSSREELSVRVPSLLLSDAFQVVLRSRGSSDAAL